LPSLNFDGKILASRINQTKMKKIGERRVKGNIIIFIEDFEPFLCI
jgi:hypothetical protein